MNALGWAATATAGLAIWSIGFRLVAALWRCW